MSSNAIAKACAVCGIAAGRAIRDAVHAMPLGERGRRTASQLKRRNVAVDAEAERIALQHLRVLARELDRRVAVLLDDRGATEVIGSSSHGEVIWACIDAIDGTKKVAGIRKPTARRIDAANDGAWAATFAFTAPTRKSFDELVLGDFSTAVVIDGNPTKYPSYPHEVITLPGARRRLVAYDLSVSEGPKTADHQRRLFTSSCKKLNQVWVFLDSFQAFDLETRRRGDGELAVELYRLLINRHAPTGAHDVLRQFGSLSALCRTMLGWREKPVWLESQGGAFIVVNENLPNLIPSVAVIAGAGGLSVDFDGGDLRRRRLVEGRTSVVHAANGALRDQCLRVVEKVRRI